MRMGKKKQPTYRVVAADKRKARNGKFIEVIGFYDPKQDPSVIEIENEKAVHWLNNGAQPSERVEKLLKISGAWDDFKGLIPEDNLPKGHKMLINETSKDLPCYALFRKLVVLMDGTIQGCACRIEPDLWTDNIMNYEDLSSAWKNNKLEKIRHEWLDKKIIPDSCKTCTHYIPVTNLLAVSTPKYIFNKIKLYLRKKLN